jgi:hypothetical protein
LRQREIELNLCLEYVSEYTHVESMGRFFFYVYEIRYSNRIPFNIRVESYKLILNSVTFQNRFQCSLSSPVDFLCFFLWFVIILHTLISFQVSVHYLCDLVGQIIAGVVSHPFSNLMC